MLQRDNIAIYFLYLFDSYFCNKSSIQLRMQVENVLKSLKLELEQRKIKHFPGRRTLAEEVS